MRVAAFFVLLSLGCARRDVDGGPAHRAPRAIGGGPVSMAVSPAGARTQIARARCAVIVACSEEESDACITREEATMAPITCSAIDRTRLDACVERTRARTCTDSTPLFECGGNQLCSKEDQP
jgi:hypothetical protein